MNRFLRSGLGLLCVIGCLAMAAFNLPLAIILFIAGMVFLFGG